MQAQLHAVQVPKPTLLAVGEGMFENAQEEKAYKGHMEYMQTTMALLGITVKPENEPAVAFLLGEVAYMHIRMDRLRKQVEYYAGAGKKAHQKRGADDAGGSARD